MFTEFRRLLAGTTSTAVVAGLVVTGAVVGSVATTAPAAADVPTPGDTQSVITVKVGGDRSGVQGVTALQGVQLQLWDGGDSGPTGPTTVDTGHSTTCTSDAQGDCSFVIYNTGSSSPNDANRNKRFWIKRTGSPTGWFGLDALRVGTQGPPAWPLADYQFRTGDTLTGGNTYRSTSNFMIATGLSNNVASGGIWQTSRNNPSFPAQCGIDVALVIDLSNSVSADELTELKTAVNTFVRALQGTPSRVALYTFATNAPADGSTNITRALTPVSTAAGVTTVQGYVNGLVLPGGDDGGTNWDRGIAQVAQSGESYDAAIVLTDGNPTFYNDPAQGPGGRTRFRELENGIFSANAVKAENTKMIAFGVGDDVSGDPANLQAISGPLVNDDYFQAADYLAAGDKLALRI